MTSSHQEKHWFRLSGDHAKQPLIKIIIRTWKWHMGFNSGLSWKSLETIKLALSLQSHTKWWWCLRQREVKTKSNIISTALYSGPAVFLCEVKHTLTLQPVLFHVFSDQKWIHLDTKKSYFLFYCERPKKRIEKRAVSFMTCFSMSRAFVLFHLKVTAVHHHHPFLHKYQTLTSHQLSDSPHKLPHQLWRSTSNTH